MWPILLTSSSESSNLMPFILAIILIFIIPMLMSRYGVSMEDIIRKIFGSGIGKKGYSALEEEKKSRDKANRKEPHLNNSSHNDLIQMVSDLILFSRKNNTGLVYPATIVHNGKTGNLVAFVVTKSRVIGMNCFGFGGTIARDGTTGEWTQHINGVTQSIPDPEALNKEQYELARAAMDANGMKDLPLDVMAVFTNKHVTLTTSRVNVYNTHDMIQRLAQIIADEKAEFDPNETAKRVNAIVSRIPQQRKKRR